MRLRPIGPGIGGLNYESLLKDSRRPDEAAVAARRATQRELAAGHKAGTIDLGRSIVAMAKRFADRFCEARLEQARQTIARHGGGLAYDATVNGRNRRYY